MFSYVRMLYICGLFFVVIKSTEALGYDVNGLYQARVAVLDRTDVERFRGASLALSRVLVKLTGQIKPVSSPELEELQNRAGELLLQYTYEKHQEKQKLFLVAEFDQKALAEELKLLDVPVWGKERPSTFMHVIVSRPSGRRVFTAREMATRLFEERAAYRGVPIVFPQKNEIDSDWSNFLPADIESFLNVKSMSLGLERDIPSVMLGYISQSSFGIWESEWVLQVGAEKYQWKLESDILELLIEGSIDVLADSLARRFADPELLARAEKLTIEVSGILSVDDYARVCIYIDSLDTVSKFFVREISDDTLLLDVVAKGGPKALRQSISFGGLLVGLNDDLLGYALTSNKIETSTKQGARSR